MKQEKQIKVKKTKEEKRYEKELNKSLKPVSSKTKQFMGVYGLQPDDMVFYMGNSHYIKIYQLMNIPKEKRDKEYMIHLLTDMTMNRMRITGILGEPSSFFLTVFFEGSKYIEIHDEIKKFEETLQESVLKTMHLDAVGCEIDQMLSLIGKNFKGETIPIEYSESIKKKENWYEMLFARIGKIDKGTFMLIDSDRSGCSLLAEEYPAKIRKKFDFKKMECQVLYALDFQPLSEEDTELLNYMIRQKYNVSQESLSEQKSINFTYTVCILADTDEKRREISDLYMKELKKQDVLIHPAVDQEQEIYESILSFGIKDFRAMRNVNIDIIGDFLA